MGLAGSHTTDQTINRYDIPDAQYYELMRSLNSEQMQFLYDTVYLLKSTHAPIYQFYQEVLEQERAMCFVH
jgi:hypothetical protein